MADRTPAQIGAYDPNMECPKCGEEVVATSYHVSAACCSYDVRWGRNAPSGEHLCRTCSRCHYAWVQAVLG